jgi:hypothetical protein
MPGVKNLKKIIYHCDDVDVTTCDDDPYESSDAYTLVEAGAIPPEPEGEYNAAVQNNAQIANVKANIFIVNLR